MTDTAPIDYKAAFEEMTLLNRLFDGHRNYLVPRLDPDRFIGIRTEDPALQVVIQGVRSGLYFRSARSSVVTTYGTDYAYSPFQRVVAKERTLVEWLPADV